MNLSEKDKRKNSYVSFIDFIKEVRKLSTMTDEEFEKSFDLLYEKFMNAAIDAQEDKDWFDRKRLGW